MELFHWAKNRHHHVLGAAAALALAAQAFGQVGDLQVGRR
jgi:hypothetical protein